MLVDNGVTVEETWRDNSGKKKYYDKMPFPTLDFLSDHAITTTIVSVKEEEELLDESSAKLALPNRERERER